MGQEQRLPRQARLRLSDLAAVKDAAGMTARLHATIDALIEHLALQKTVPG